jgi:hypothetical protein
MQPWLVFWILGAPLALALIDLARTPKVHRHRNLGSNADPVR